MVDNVDKTPKTRMNTHFFLTTSVAQVCSRLKEVFVDKKNAPGADASRAGRDGMTKDAEKVLRRLYRAYKKRRRVMGRRQAMDFLIADEDAALDGIPGAEAYAALCELQEAGFLSMYTHGGCELKVAALEYEESRLSRGLSCLLDVFSKLRP